MLDETFTKMQEGSNALKWDVRFLNLCKHVAGWSKDPSTQVGAVITRPDNTIVSLGYNGFPRGVNDDPARYADRQTKYAFVVHAEVNAILSASESLHGYTLYVYPMFPCNDCAKIVCQSGIKRVVSINSKTHIHWQAMHDTAKLMFKEVGIVYDMYEDT